MSATFRWIEPPTIMAGKLDGYKSKLVDAVGSLCDFFAAQIEAQARQLARWIDRTGHARAGLTTKVIKAATTVTIVLFHTVSYGIWLETKRSFGGRYAIILQTLQFFYSQIMAAIQSLLR